MKTRVRKRSSDRGMVGVAVVVLMAIDFPVIIFLHAPSALMAITSVPCLLLITWSLWGAPHIRRPPPLFLGTLVLGLGLPALLMDTAPWSFSAWWVAVPLSIGGFTALGYVLTRIGLARTGSTDTQLRILVALALYAGVGITAFEPMVNLANAWRDLHPPQVLPGTVTDRYTQGNKSPTDYVVLAGPAAAFSSFQGAGTFEVNRWIYESLHRGDKACVTVHTGLLHLEWWSIGPCA